MRALTAVVLALAVWTISLPAQTGWLSASQQIAPGILYFTSTDRTLVEDTGPIAVYLLRLDPARVRLVDTLARGEVLGTETVQTIAANHQAVAAINGGFFNRANGEPVGILKIGGELVSDSSVVRGAVLIHSPPMGRTSLEFDQLSVSMTLSLKIGSRTWRLPIDGIDTTRARGKLMLYTPRYHADTDTAATGTEWVLEGQPLRVTSMRRLQGHTIIPRHGVVLSYGGVDLPPALAALSIDQPVSLTTVWTAVNGLTAAALDRADSIVNGAGLLRLHGRTLDNWETVERLSAENFINMRHPRTLIGVDESGAIWMGAIDGRQPDHSIGMTLPDLARLAERLHLRDALNLDGGGSTTLVANSRILNMPSDPTGPRPISDAILVMLR